MVGLMVLILNYNIDFKKDIWGVEIDWNWIKVLYCIKLFEVVLYYFFNWYGLGFIMF